MEETGRRGQSKEQDMYLVWVVKRTEQDEIWLVHMVLGAGRER